jgi:hypothetical protein
MSERTILLQELSEGAVRERQHFVGQTIACVVCHAGG